MFYLVNEYVFGYEEEEEEVEPGAETAAPSIALSANQAEGGVQGTEAPELDQVEESLVQVPDKPPEGALFIPLWWGKKSTPTPYKTSDPEWQGYVKLAKDPRRMEEVKGKTDELDPVLWKLILSPESLCAQMLSQMPTQWTKLLGSPLRISRTMLDFQYQGGRRPEYERLGYV